jgi:predicted GNAT family acetyltransferase
MGDYFGVFKDNTLVAVTGERMKMNEFTEVSAVVTHPLYTGRGYAKQLVAYTVNKIFDQNKTPYLHVAEKNNGAIRLYEKLGFKTRRKISFWNFVTD